MFGTGGVCCFGRNRGVVILEVLCVSETETFAEFVAEGTVGVDGEEADGEDETGDESKPGPVDGDGAGKRMGTKDLDKNAFDGVGQEDGGEKGDLVEFVQLAEEDDDTDHEGRGENGGEGDGEEPAFRVAETFDEEEIDIEGHQRGEAGIEPFMGIHENGREEGQEEEQQGRNGVQAPGESTVRDDVTKEADGGGRQQHHADERQKETLAATDLLLGRTGRIRLFGDGLLMG